MHDPTHGWLGQEDPLKDFRNQLLAGVHCHFTLQGKGGLNKRHIQVTKDWSKYVVMSLLLSSADFLRCAIMWPPLT